MPTTAKDFSELAEHMGHACVVVSYDDGEEMAIECEKCNCVLYSADINE